MFCSTTACTAGKGVHTDRHRCSLAREELPRESCCLPPQGLGSPEEADKGRGAERLSVGVPRLPGSGLPEPPGSRARRHALQALLQTKAHPTRGVT